MFSGKTEELIRRVRRAKISKKSIVVFKPKIDDRYDGDQVVGHDGSSIPCLTINVEDSQDILRMI
ncbi:MAG: thymidine kinase, partial [Candidatus Geothermarchaeales archaeon]